MKEIHYEDEAGNKIITDNDGRLAVVNRQGRIVNPKDSDRLFRKAGFKIKRTGRTYKIGGGATVTPSHVTFPDRQHNKIDHAFNLDLGEPKGFYFGTREKKQKDFGEVDFDWGLKI